MKRVWIILAVSLGVLSLALFGGYQYLIKQHAEKEAEIQKKAEAAGVTEEEFIEQTQLIGGISYEVELDEKSTQDEVIEVMHKMTHQKVRAEEKWGAIPMIPETINDVYEIVSKSNFERKEDLLEILEKWKLNNFLSTDEDHNYFWRYQGGTVGKAYGTMSRNEEMEFIKNNFKNGENE